MVQQRTLHAILALASVAVCSPQEASVIWPTLLHPQASIAALSTPNLADRQAPATPTTGNGLFPDPPPEFKPLDIVPGKATIINSCSYTAYLNSTLADGCHMQTTSAEIPAGGKWSEPAVNCGDGNTVLKVYKNKEPVGEAKGVNPPMQFEYGKRDGKIWYNLSFKDCVSGDTVNDPDLSKCVSWDGGMQIGASGNCHRFWCKPHEKNCCDRGYCDDIGKKAREMYANNEPCIGCGTGVAEGNTDVDGLGLTVQLCAIGA